MSQKEEDKIHIFGYLGELIRELREQKYEVRKQRQSNYTVTTISGAALLAISGLVFILVALVIDSLLFKEGLKILGQIFISAGVGVFIAGTIQALRNITIAKTLSEEVSEKIIKEYKHIGERMLPNKIYRSNDKDYIEVTDKGLDEVRSFKFMSISGLALLTKRLPKLKRDTKLSIDLLMVDPFEGDHILKLRGDQLKNYENKTAQDLKKEIIYCVIQAACLKIKNKYIHFRIRFHNEIPFCRFEFIGEQDLFLSYYKSRENSGLGPVLRYEADRDVFLSLNQYFNDVWERFTDYEIIIYAYALSSEKVMVVELRQA